MGCCNLFRNANRLVFLGLFGCLLALPARSDELNQELPTPVARYFDMTYRVQGREVPVRFEVAPDGHLYAQPQFAPGNDTLLWIVPRNQRAQIRLRGYDEDSSRVAYVPTEVFSLDDEVYLLARSSLNIQLQYVLTLKLRFLNPPEPSSSLGAVVNTCITFGGLILGINGLETISADPQAAGIAVAGGVWLIHKASQLAASSGASALLSVCKPTLVGGDPAIFLNASDESRRLTVEEIHRNADGKIEDLTYRALGPSRELRSFKELMKGSKCPGHLISQALANSGTGHSPR
ncbi:MAG: hypothetical protein AB7G93_07730 [Bdellovibrionales bacterium]